MRVDLFDFELPTDRIALRPASPRDSARLLKVEGGAISDHGVRDLPALLRPGDLLVFNDTKVIPAQLEGRRGEARIGATLHKREGPRAWRAFVRNAKAERGRRGRFRGRVTAMRASGRTALPADFAGEEPVELLLERPPDAVRPIRRQRAATRAIATTIRPYSRARKARRGSTAALHFTPR